jgi:putative copper export protein
VLDAAGGAPAVAFRAIALAAITIAAGAVIFHWFVLGRVGADAHDNRAALNTMAANAGIAAGVSIVVIALPRLWWQAREFVDPGASAWPMVGNVLRTMWGKGFIAQSLSAAAAVAGFAIARKPRALGWNIAAVATAALTLSPALMGHPIAAEHRAWLAVSSDWLHVVGAGGWVGALTLLAVAGRRVRGAAMGSLIAAFHHVALSSALGLLVSGSLSLVLRLDRLGDLLGSPYGTIFFVKIGCVAAVAALGAWHSAQAEHRARTAGGVGQSMFAEVAFATLALAMTAVLVGTEPPGGHSGS